MRKSGWMSGTAAVVILAAGASALAQIPSGDSTEPTIRQGNVVSRTDSAAGDQGPVISRGPMRPESGSLPPLPAGIGDRPIDAKEARVVANELAHEMEAYYVDPEVGRRYAKAIRDKASSGAYDSIRSSAALAERLSADVNAVHRDNHLHVRVGLPDGPRPSERAAAPPPPPRQNANFRLIARPMEGSLESPQQLAPGIVYLRVNNFVGDDAQLAAVDKFMREASSANSIIFDVRTARGGGTAEADVIFPYLVAEPTTLAIMETRAESDAISFTRHLEGPTMRRIEDRDGYVRRQHIIEPHPPEKRLANTKIFVLTSRTTGSAAEHFAMAFKHTGRGTLIGETTAGAGHTTMMRSLGGGFGVAVPVGRTVDPKSGKGWEGSGIEPHLKVPAEEAMVEALVRSGLTRAQAARISAGLSVPRPQSES